MIEIRSFFIRKHFKCQWPKKNTISKTTDQLSPMNTDAKILNRILKTKFSSKDVKYEYRKTRLNMQRLEEYCTLKPS